MTLSSEIVDEKSHFLACLTFSILSAPDLDYMSRDIPGEEGTACTGFLEPSEHTSSQFHVHG